MINIKLILLFCLSTLVTNVFGFTEKAKLQFHEGPVFSAKEKAGSEGKLYFLKFSAEWCMPCRWMEETTFTEPNLQSFIHENYIPVKVNIDDFDGFALKEKYKVNTIPTIIIFNSKGQMIKKIEEAMGPTNLLNLLSEANIPDNKVKIYSPEKIEPKAITSKDIKTARPILTAPARPIIPANFNNSNEVDNTHIIERDIIPVMNNRSYNNNLTQTTIASKGVDKYGNSNSDLHLAENETLEEGLFLFDVSKQDQIGFGIQLGVYNVYSNVLTDAAKIKAKYNKNVVVKITKYNGITAYKVLVGAFQSIEDAKYQLSKIKEFRNDAFIKDLSTL